MNICVIGTGYVGLPQATLLAASGHQVVGLDIHAELVSRLNAGECTIYEAELPQMLRTALDGGQLRFTTDYGKAIAKAEIVFICVGTPEGDDGACDLSAVFAAARDLAPHLSPDTVVATRSTVPVGTTHKVEQTIAESTRVRFHIANNPEFLQEGTAVRNLRHPDRIVIGTASAFARDKLVQLYRGVVGDKVPILTMDIASSELVKYASNAMLAMRISFANEIANLCEKVGANYHDVERGVGADKRIGASFLRAGVGFGGSCFPKDVRALTELGREQELPLQLAEATLKVNELQPQRFLALVQAHLPDGISGKTIAVWGLTFKPDTDDMRNAPSIPIIRGLVRAGARVQAYDPQGMEEAKQALDDVEIAYVDDAYRALDGANALVLITEWGEFREPDFARIAAALADKVVFDGRNLWKRQDVEAAGLTYFGVGT